MCSLLCVSNCVRIPYAGHQFVKSDIQGDENREASIPYQHRVWCQRGYPGVALTKRMRQMVAQVPGFKRGSIFAVLQRTCDGSLRRLKHLQAQRNT